MAKPLPVALCYVHNGLVRAEFHDSCMAVSQRYELGLRIGVYAGALVANARNRVVRAFLETEAEYLWFVDTDMKFDPYVVEDLLEADKPIVSALCYAMHESGVTFPASFTWEKGKLINGFPAPKEDPVVEVAGTGAACILIRREVLESMALKFEEPYVWYQETVNPATKKPIGEDLTFCLRAAEVGFPTYLHTGIHVGHIKVRIV